MEQIIKEKCIISFDQEILELIFSSISMASTFSRFYFNSEISTINHCIVNCFAFIVHIKFVIFSGNFILRSLFIN